MHTWQMAISDTDLLLNHTGLSEMLQRHTAAYGCTVYRSFRFLKIQLYLSAIIVVNKDLHNGDFKQQWPRRRQIHVCNFPVDISQQ